jgi:hypothetical protein
MEARYKEIKPGYRVGDDGTVWSCMGRVGFGKYSITDRWHQLKPQPIDKYGHLHVMVGGRRSRAVHRMVLEAFVGPCPPGMMCRHLDGDPTNNRVENLEWGTRLRNSADMVKHGRAGMAKGEKNSGAVIIEDKVLQIVKVHQCGGHIAEIAVCMGICKTSVRNIIKGQTWKHVTSN